MSRKSAQQFCDNDMQKNEYQGRDAKKKRGVFL